MSTQTQSISCEDYIAACLNGDYPVDHQNSDGETSLHIACLFADLNSVKVLIEKGADPFICTNDGETSFAYTCKDDTEETMPTIREYLINSVTDINHQNIMLHDAYFHGRDDSITLLLDAGADPDVVNDIKEYRKQGYE